MSTLLQRPVETKLDSLPQLLKALQSRSARVGILGLGYVGMPLALRCSEVGFPVMGFDIDEEKVERLNAGRSDIAHIPSERIVALREAGFEATNDFSRASDVDVLILRSPLTRHREPDLSFVISTVESLLPICVQAICFRWRARPILEPRQRVCPLGERLLARRGGGLVVYSPNARSR